MEQPFEKPAPRAMVTALMDAMFDAADNAASCSHRPTHVEHIFLDANSRHCMAQAILAMPEMQSVRAALRAHVIASIRGYDALHGDTLEDFIKRHAGLPPTVAGWVLS